MPLYREEILRKKREYARRKYLENPEAARAINAASVARAKSRIGAEAYAARHREYCRKYVSENKDARRESYTKYQKNNPEKVRLASAVGQRKYRKKNPEACAARFASWAEKNKGYWSKWMARRRKEDPEFLIGVRMRGRLYAELRKGRYAKSASVFKRETEMALEWFDWLSRSGVVDWTAHGIHIDHVLPVSSFDMMNPLDVYAANHWTNLLPMSQEENSRKHDSTDPQYLEKQRELVSRFLGERFKNKLAA